MTKHLAKRSVLSPTPIMRWCQQRLHRFRPSGTSEQVRYLTRTEKRADQDLISPPHSPPPRYELLADNLPSAPRISHIPADWQRSMGPKNSVLRGNNFQPDENQARRDQFVS
ncbi:hypothetical protein MJO28_011609 [Puccinia striiformis f. sp. tritici]|uniref:Uncharacterized protein n=4 Tax=Puccinia striiformis TaxID=27350 RepID=A0A0L0VPL5_9BASI|nr:hypothetical protein Pst134EA_021205 [Puccinia striiformis f. sp. tritici]KAI9624499.1 hypothetical protein KEM48_008824 [Puccinia striiformis f. sp. tritici PST-130]KNF01211.1 hypothetical protein PSTG_05567 [Puccinia striiformis f. sp. tritici PST-78]POW00596.1 hypothetical protein PSHT_12972 [Puccinia striiformis]KAH9448049.1 hypothetical protein Pst134EB_022036 [Puccinia striiformis f. sp. tritici]KAH9457321.1 hypothetical protein Pst134EA_021205 [Puccinia striiformis f. sp. tritici]